MIFLKKVVLVLMLFVLYACANPSLPEQSGPPPEQPNPPEQTDPITSFTPEQTEKLAQYFGISTGAPASAEQKKIVSGGVAGQIQVTAAAVLSYADTKGTERAGFITARISGTYRGRVFKDTDIVFTGFTDVYGSTVWTAGTFALNLEPAMAAALSIDAYITAVNENPAAYISAFDFRLYNGTPVDALDSGNRGYSVDNIQVSKTADSVPRIQLNAQYRVHYFSREPGKEEVAETVTQGWRPSVEIKAAYYTQNDVLNYILADEGLILSGSGTYSGRYASELYARQKFDDQYIWTLLFSSDTINRYRALYPAYGTLVVAISELAANDMTGELHVTYYIISQEDLEDDISLNTSVRKSHTFAGFKTVYKEELERILLPNVLPTDAGTADNLFKRYDTAFKAALSDGRYQDIDKTYDLYELNVPDVDRGKVYAVVREADSGIIIGDGGGVNDGFSTSVRKILFDGKSAFEIFRATTPFLANKKLFISHVEVKPVSVTANPAVKDHGGVNYLYLYNYEVSFDVAASTSASTHSTEAIVLTTSMRSY